MGRLKERKQRTDIHRESFRYRMMYVHSYLYVTLSYSRAEVAGLENIPENAAVIFAPNHCNTLMDALVVLRSRWKPTVFGARADLFKIKLLGKFMHFLKIVPMVRSRDGIRNVVKNLDTMEDMVEVLSKGLPFCIFPEGTHRPKHSLMPLLKGVQRVARMAYDELKDREVYIVPVGLEYGDYFRFRSTSLVHFGEPLNVSEFLKANPEMSEPESYRKLNELLSDKMSKLITYIPDDENYDAVWAYTKVKTAGCRKGSLLDQQKRRQEVVASAATVPAETLQAALDLDRKRKSAGISFKSFGYRNSGLRLAGKTLGLIALMPMFLYFAITSLLHWLPSEIVCARMIKDKAFANSIKTVLYVMLWPIVMLITAIVLLCTVGWKIALAQFILMIFAPAAFYQFIEWFRVWFSDLRLLFRKDLRKAFDAIR